MAGSSHCACVYVRVQSSILLPFLLLSHRHAQYKLDAAAKRREAALAAQRPPSAFKVESLTHAPTYHAQFLDTGTANGKAFHFDTLLTYGHAAQNSSNSNNNSVVNASET